MKRFLVISLLWITILSLIGCRGQFSLDGLFNGRASGEDGGLSNCPVTEPVWIKPPEDSAVSGEPAFGNYYVNDDRSIFASAWWSEHEELFMVAGEKGNKVGWFRPAGSRLEISGQRLGAKAPEMTSHVPCCYPTRFQATGLIFPTEGCWEVTASAAESELSFVVYVSPEP